MLARKDREPSDVAAGSRHARDKSAADWIGHGDEHNRNCPGSLHQRCDDGGAVAENAIGLKLDQARSRMPACALESPSAKRYSIRRFWPSDQPSASKTLFESRDASLGLRIVCESHQHPDRVHANCLLCIRRDRPAGQCATENEL